MTQVECVLEHGLDADVLSFVVDDVTLLDFFGSSGIDHEETMTVQRLGVNRIM